MTLTSYFRTPHRQTTDIDVSSIAFWQRDFRSRDDSFAQLRRNAPVSWHPPLATPGLPKRYREAGFWAVTTAETISLVSRNAHVFSSEIGQVGLRPAPFRLSDNMLVTDPPRHAEFRRVIGSAFTPRAVARLDHDVKRRAAQIVGRAALNEEFDFVEAVATPLPLRTIADLIGVPDAEHERFTQLAGEYVRTRIPSDTSGQPASEFIGTRGEYLRGLCARLCWDRRREPADDLITALVHGEVNGRPMTEDEIFSTMLLLIAAGDDTMTQTTTLAFLALQHFPEQRAWLQADFDERFDVAFDEFVRYASPILSFARTAAEDTELGGQTIAAGDKVALFYCSGNRDESLFASPHDLDLSRRPNQHVAFGGGGVHYCLGAALARTQLRALIGEILRRLPDVELGDPVFGFSEAVHTVETLPVRNNSRRSARSQR